MWLDAKPADHTPSLLGVCVGCAAMHNKPLMDPHETPGLAMRILATRPEQCKCRAHNVGIRGRRAAG